MFCPRCGTENSSQQRYCRQCGLPLFGARLNLDGQADEALADLKTGIAMLSRTVTVVLIFIPLLFLALLAVGTFDVRIFALSMSIVFGVTVPFVIYCLSRFRRAGRLLKLSDDAIKPPQVTGSKDTKGLPEPSTFAGQLIPSKEPVFATEDTTRKLKPSQKDRSS